MTLTGDEIHWSERDERGRPASGVLLALSNTYPSREVFIWSGN